MPPSYFSNCLNFPERVTTLHFSLFREDSGCAAAVTVVKMGKAARHGGSDHEQVRQGLHSDPWPQNRHGYELKQCSEVSNGLVLKPESFKKINLR